MHESCADLLSEKLTAAFDRLPVLRSRKADVVRWVQLLSSLHQANGRQLRPARYRPTTARTAIKELRSVAAQAHKLQGRLGHQQQAARTARHLLTNIEKLHSTAILSLANAGFLAREELIQYARAVADGSYNSDERLENLVQVQSAALRAVTSLETSLGTERSTRSAPNNDLATAVAGIAYTAYSQLTGKAPTVAVDAIQPGHAASGPFLNFLQAVLLALNIKGSPEALARQIIRQRRPRG